MQGQGGREGADLPVVFVADGNGAAGAAACVCAFGREAATALPLFEIGRGPALAGIVR